MKLDGKTAFVSGGTGFVGGRLIESLVCDQGVRVRALVRGTEVGPGAARAARWGVEFVEADITDETSLAEGISGCDLIFHCAFGSHGTIAEQRRITVDGTAALLRACERARGVSRFVNLSTATVFGIPSGSSIDETTPPQPSPKWHYAKDKWDAEQLVANSSLPTTTLRLSSVYGPRSPAFTIMPILELKSGQVVLVNGGSGQLNPVYIDDVIQAMLLASIRPEAVGETFLLSGPDSVTRREFYERYAKMLNLENRIVGMSPEEIRKAHRKNRWSATKALPQAAKTALKQDAAFTALVRQSHLGAVAQSIWKHIRKENSRSTEPSASLPLILPPDFMIDYFASPACFVHSKAKFLLGYDPKFSFEEGMELTGKWARWARLID